VEGDAMKKPTPRELLVEAIASLEEPLDKKTQELLEGLAHGPSGSTRVAAIRKVLVAKK